MKYLVDTSIFIDCLRKEVVPSSRLFLESLGNGNEGYTSSITVAELSVGAHLSKRPEALEKTLELLDVVNIIGVDVKIAIEAGRIYAELVKNGEMIELNDCLIAATAFSSGIDTIVTRNIKHFLRIKHIKALTPDEI